MNPQVLEIGVTGARDQLTGGDVDQPSAAPEPVQLITIGERSRLRLIAASRGRIERSGRVPECSKQRHPAGEVPHARRYHATASGYASHLARAFPRVGHETHD